MTVENDTTFHNIFNSLGYIATPLIFLNVLIGWLPILICFNSYDYSVGWNDSWIDRWAFLEVLFFGALAVLAVVISAGRIDLRALPTGWHFLWLLSIWPTSAETPHFGRSATASNSGSNHEAFDMSEDDKNDMPAKQGRPDRYSAVRPGTTVSGKKVTLSNFIPTLVESKFERMRETVEGKEVIHQIKTLKTKTEANVAFKEYVGSELDADFAAEQADQRNKLQMARNAREMAEIDRDIKDIREGPKEPQPKQKRTYADEVAEKLKKGAMGRHEAVVEDQIREDAKQWNGEENAPEERRELYRRLRQEAAQKDEGRG